MKMKFKPKTKFGENLLKNNVEYIEVVTFTIYYDVFKFDTYKRWGHYIDLKPSEIKLLLIADDKEKISNAISEANDKINSRVRVKKTTVKTISMIDGDIIDYANCVISIVDNALLTKDQLQDLSDYISLINKQKEERNQYPNVVFI